MRILVQVLNKLPLGLLWAWGIVSTLYSCRVIPEVFKLSGTNSVGLALAPMSRQVPAASPLKREPATVDPRPKARGEQVAGSSSDPDGSVAEVPHFGAEQAMKPLDLTALYAPIRESIATGRPMAGEARDPDERLEITFASLDEKGILTGTIALGAHCILRFQGGVNGRFMSFRETTSEGLAPGCSAGHFWDLQLRGKGLDGRVFVEAEPSNSRPVTIRAR